MVKPKMAVYFSKIQKTNNQNNANDNLYYTTGKPLSNKPKPTKEITGTIPRGLKNL